jgi:YggT family protein
MSNAFIIVINTLANVLSLLIIIDSLLSFVLSPFHPVREVLGRVLLPLYAPIRRILPPAGGMDFSPLVLLVLITVLKQILFAIFR